MKKYSYNELKAFIGRADTLEKAYIARQYLQKINYIRLDAYNNLMQMIERKVEDYEESLEESLYFSSSIYDYSPAAPWNAPGMSVRDFIQ